MSMLGKNTTSRRTNRKTNFQSAASNQPRFDTENQNVRQHQPAELTCQTVVEVNAIYNAFYQRFNEKVRGVRVSWILDSELDGGRWDNQRGQTIWVKIADFISSLQLPIFEFIRQKFFFYSQTAPGPLAMLTEIGADELRSSLERATKEAEHQLKCQME